MPPYKKEEWVTGGTPVVARMLQARLFEGDTEFPVGTTVAYERSHFMVGMTTQVARFNGQRWDVTGLEESVATVDLIEELQSHFVAKIWLLEPGATIYQRDEKEEF